LGTTPGEGRSRHDQMHVCVTIYAILIISIQDPRGVRLNRKTPVERALRMAVNEHFDVSPPGPSKSKESKIDELNL